MRFKCRFCVFFYRFLSLLSLAIHVGMGDAEFRQACLQRHFHVMTSLLERGGVDVNSMGGVPLIACAVNQDALGVNLLQRSGCLDVAASNSTALRIAACNDDIPILTMLLRSDRADPNIVLEYTHTCQGVEAALSSPAIDIPTAIQQLSSRPPDTLHNPVSVLGRLLSDPRVSPAFFFEQVRTDVWHFFHGHVRAHPVAAVAKAVEERDPMALASALTAPGVTPEHKRRLLSWLVHHDSFSWDEDLDRDWLEVVSPFIQDADIRAMDLQDVFALAVSKGHLALVRAWLADEGLGVGTASQRQELFLSVVRAARPALLHCLLQDPEGRFSLPEVGPEDAWQAFVAACGTARDAENDADSDEELPYGCELCHFAVPRRHVLFCHKTGHPTGATRCYPRTKPEWMQHCIQHSVYPGAVVRCQRKAYIAQLLYEDSEGVTNGEQETKGGSPFEADADADAPLRRGEGVQGDDDDPCMEMLLALLNEPTLLLTTEQLNDLLLSVVLARQLQSFSVLLTLPQAVPGQRPELMSACLAAGSEYLSRLMQHPTVEAGIGHDDFFNNYWWESKSSAETEEVLWRHPLMRSPTSMLSFSLQNFRPGMETMVESLLTCGRLPVEDVVASLWLAVTCPEVLARLIQHCAQ